MESLGISFCVTPFIFSQKISWHPSLTPVHLPPWRFWQSPHLHLTRNQPHRGHLSPACWMRWMLLNSMFRTLEARHRCLEVWHLLVFVFGSVPKLTRWKPQKNSTKMGCEVGISWFEYVGKKTKDFRVSARSRLQIYINPGPYPSFEEKTFWIWIRDVKFMNMLRPHLGLTSFCWSAMLFWTEIS